MQRTISIASAPPPFAALGFEAPPAADGPRAAISAALDHDETGAVRALLEQAAAESAADREQARARARQLVSAVRARRVRASGMDALMHEFSLSSEEGVALMCLAEALLRIPDNRTADRLIADQIGKGDWGGHVGASASLFVNAAAWGLLITGKLLDARAQSGLGATLAGLLARGGDSLIRNSLDLAMRLLGRQFVAGRTIAEALRNSRDNVARGYLYSYDMLGEAALTAADAARYHAAYEDAIHAIGRAAAGLGVRRGPGVSIKLSALHPRYCRAQRGRVMAQLLPRVTALALLAKRYDIGLNIDAEEADRLELSLDLLEALALDPRLAGFDGIGFVVQAYQKRCPFVIDHLIDLARRSGHRLMVRLVKGAYWDAEIKRAQVAGLAGYPVFTRKAHTDVCYLVCAKKLLAANALIYPQFATHNAHTLAVIETWAGRDGVDDYEFQCLHGMGETLYDQVVGPGKPCRIYAPVGPHATLLAYLVRRLLENGANASFVHQLVDPDIALDALIADPFDSAARMKGAPHPGIASPARLFGDERRNSTGLDLANENTLRALAGALAERRAWAAAPLIDGDTAAATARAIVNPARADDVVGAVIEAGAADIETALASASACAHAWRDTAPALRADALERAAELFEQHRHELMALAVREAGKSLPNALGEVREAVDFLRYYAAQARAMANTPALGPVVCISPWNFPLSIFTGQVGAALAAGNVVLAKPAEQTPLMAHRATRLLHAAGVPRGALQLLPGAGETIGAGLCRDRRVRGVIFTGSTDVARQINHALAERAAEEQCELALIAETGGQNAMIVDSSALPEQVVQDAIASAFDSAGQRCSALRALFLQEEIADRTIAMLQGAMRELSVGNPDRLATDIGPVIDRAAQQNLQAHIDRMRATASMHFAPELGPELADGIFVAPTLLEIASLAELPHEVFGPVLHVIRYKSEQLAQVVEQINASGYGLTLGIHSRVDATIAFIAGRARVGNIYVNRNIIGAVVGVQPFGGEGKSGTGPKAGGPLYLKRLQNQAPAPSLQGRRAPAGLDALAMWAAQHGHQTLARLAGQYADTTPLDATMVLPGPTGERNTLHFAARGRVLCAAATTGVLLNQLAAALATGNEALVLTGSATLIPPDLPDAVSARLRLLDDVDIGADDFQVAMIDPALARRMKPLLARREGALVSTLDTGETAAIPLWRLIVERALCVNTAAAGGNASLMALDN